jgi:hypothetical protein
MTFPSSIDHRSFSRHEFHMFLPIVLFPFLGTPWAIPVLMGPSVPSVTKDAELRAKILLLLLKPWTMVKDWHMIPSLFGDIMDEPMPRDGLWVAAWDEWHKELQYECSQLDIQEPSPRFSEDWYRWFFAHKSVEIVQNLNQMASRRPPEVALNPNGEWDITKEHGDSNNDDHMDNTEIEVPDEPTDTPHASDEFELDNSQPQKASTPPI